MHGREPAELIVHDSAEPCPYLPGQQARMPLRMPTSRLSPEQLDQRLARGDRRSGMYLYHTACPRCRACEPIRIPIDRFMPSQTQRRVQRRGDRLLNVQLGPARADAERVRLLNAHRLARGLDQHREQLDTDQYESFLVDSCCETFELRYECDGALVAVAVTDRGAMSLSAVYCCFDPAYSHLSLGTYSVLKQLELCRTWKLEYLYLGLYIAQSAHMSYKARFRPHERLVDGAWRSFDRE